MFEDFYECAQTPFSRDIPTSELYPSGAQEELLGRLGYAASNQLFAVLTGDCGTGKTTMLRKLKDSLDESRYLSRPENSATTRHLYPATSGHNEPSATS